MSGIIFWFMTALVTGAFGCSGAWVIRGLLVKQPIPFPAALDDACYQRDPAPAPSTSLADGVEKTLDTFRRLQKDGRLDSRELT